MSIKTELKDESSSSSEEVIQQQSDPGDITQYDLAIRWITSEDFSQEALTKIQTILSDALEGRVSSVNIITDLTFFNSVDPKSKDIILCFNYNETNCYKQLILGPSPNDVESVEKFQYYWGEHCELRRFRDGRLLYVVPSRKNWNETYLCNEYFIKLLLTKHFGVNEKDLISNLSNITNTFPSFKQSLEVIECISELSSKIKELTLPLSVDTIKSYGSLTRYTAYSIPQKIKNLDKKYQQMYMESINLIIVFEESNKWPDEMYGIKLMKSAFSIKIKELLRKHSIYGKVTPDKFELYFKGYIFNISYEVPQELALLRMGSPEEVENYITRYRRIPVTSVWMSQFPSKYPALTESARLAKKWISSQMVSNYFNDDIVDALVIHFFLGEPIHSPQKFFLTFIEMLATNETYPICCGDGVNVDGSSKGLDFSFEDQPEISKYLNSISPSVRIVKYLCGKAKQSWKLLEHNFCLITGPKFNKTLFSHQIPKDGIKIEIDRLLLTKQNVNYNEEWTANSLSLSLKKVEVIDFDPLEIFVNELNNYFGKDILLLVDLIEGSDIVVSFNPKSPIGMLLKEKKEVCELTDVVPKENVMTWGELRKVIKLLGGSFVKEVVLMN